MHCLTNITIGSSFTIYELCDLVHLRHLSPLQFLIGKNLNKFIFKTWDSYFKINFPKVSFTYNKCTHFSIKFDDFWQMRIAQAATTTIHIKTIFILNISPVTFYQCYPNPALANPCCAVTPVSIFL